MGKKQDEMELVVGSREEWKHFAERHELFLKHFPLLCETVNRAFARLKSDAPVDLVVFCSGRLCAEEFLEILLLCGNGYGVGAMKLLRSMYERAVTARYIQQHARDAEKFIRYDAVQKGKLAQAILDVFGDGMPEHTELLKQAVQDGKAARPDYLVSDCEECGTMRLNHTWGPDLVSMARAVGALGSHLVSCYYEPLLHAHSTVHALSSRMMRVEGNSWTFDPGPQREEAATTLMRAHLLLLNILELQREHFGDESLDGPIQEYARTFREIWGIPN